MYREQMATVSLWVLVCVLAFTGWVILSGQTSDLRQATADLRQGMTKHFEIKAKGSEVEAPPESESEPEPEPEPDTLSAAVAAGEPQPAWEPTPCLTRVECLARIYYHETSGVSRVDETMLYQVLSRIGGGQPTLDTMTLYSKRATGRQPPTTDRTAWIARLDRSGDRPVNYTDTTAWRITRERWLNTLRRARQDLLNPPANPCNGRVHHWGARNIARDLERACRENWVPLDCGGTLNVGWCIGDCPEPTRSPCQDGV